MTSVAPDAGGDSVQVPASANLHTLAISLGTLKRLLDRLAQDGALSQAEPALVQMAIAAGRKTLRDVDEELAEAFADPTSPNRTAIAFLDELVSELDALPATIEGRLHRLEKSAHLGDAKMKVTPSV